MVAKWALLACKSILFCGQTGLRLDMDEVEILTRMGVALGISVLIGLERGWSERDLHEGSRVAGIRTFGLSAWLEPLPLCFPTTLAVSSWVSVSLPSPS